MSPRLRPVRATPHLRLVPPPDEPGRAHAVRRRVDVAVTTVRRALPRHLPAAVVARLWRTAPPPPARPTQATPAQTTARHVAESMRRHPSMNQEYR